MDFTTKDSGQRQVFASGMHRDIQTGKPRYDLIPQFMLDRIAGLYGRGAEKYGDNNWQLAATEEELKRYEASAFRHFIQWRKGEVDEDHGAAVFFNIAGAEHVKAKLAARPRSVTLPPNGGVVLTECRQPVVDRVCDRIKPWPAKAVKLFKTLFVYCQPRRVRPATYIVKFAKPNS